MSNLRINMSNLIRFRTGMSGKIGDWSAPAEYTIGGLPKGSLFAGLDHLILEEVPLPLDPPEKSSD